MGTETGYGCDSVMAAGKDNALSAMAGQQGNKGVSL